MMPGPALDRDLPLPATPASRFMTWITGALVYLAILAFALAAVSDARLASSAREPRMLSVSLPPPTDPGAGAAETERVLAMLRGLPGVAAAQVLSAEEMGELVEPWLGTAEDLRSLPLPRLIDVVYNPGVDPDIVAVAARIAAILPGAVVEDVPTRAVEIARTARLLRLVGSVVGLLMIGAGVVVVAVVTRMSLDQHDETVGLLRMMGAGDGFVARQFERHALSSGLRGGLTGFTLAVLTLVGTAWALQTLADMPTQELRPVDWVLLACVPVVGVLAAALAARLTASRGLARLR
jgi:cell division transport system permease protein